MVRFASATVQPPKSGYFDQAVFIGTLIFVCALPFGHTNHLLNAGMFIAICGWLARMVYERRLAWQRTALDIPIAVFLALALSSCFLSPYPSSSSFGYFWKLLRAVLLFYAVVNSRLGRRWRYLIIAAVLAGGIACGLGLWYYAHGTHLGVDYMTAIGVEYREGLWQAGQIRPDVQQALSAEGIKVSPSAIVRTESHYGDWQIDDDFKHRKYAVRDAPDGLKVYMIEPRLAGTFKMPNDLGMYLVYLLPVVLGYTVSSWCLRRGWLRRQHCVAVGGVALGLVALLMAANLVFTLTRGAWVGVFGAGVFMLLHVERRLFWAAAVVLVVLLVFAPRPVKERLQTLYERPEGFLSERPLWWRASLELIKEYPLTGIGLGRFRTAYERRSPPDVYHKPYHAHNIYLHTAVEQGLPSLLALMWIFVLIFRQVLSLRRQSDFWTYGLFLGGGGYLVSITIYGLVDHVLHQRPLLIFWFLAGVVFHVSIAAVNQGGSDEV